MDVASHAENAPAGIVDSADREAWLAERMKYLTASEVAVWLGLTYSSPKKLVRAKAGCATPKELEELAGIDDVSQVAAGRHLEEGIFKWFASETVHTTAHMFGKLIASPKDGRLASTPDALIDGSPAELKLTGEDSVPNWHECQNAYGWEKLGLGKELPTPVDVRLRLPLSNNQVAAGKRDPRSEWRRSRDHQLKILYPGLGAPRGPIKYWTQLQVQMHCLNASDGWLVGVVGGTRRYDFLYERDERFVELVLAAVPKFWAAVDAMKEQA